MNEAAVQTLIVAAPAIVGGFGEELRKALVTCPISEHAWEARAETVRGKGVCQNGVFPELAAGRSRDTAVIAKVIPGPSFF